MCAGEAAITPPSAGTGPENVAWTSAPSSCFCLFRAFFGTGWRCQGFYAPREQPSTSGWQELVKKCPQPPPLPPRVAMRLCPAALYRLPQSTEPICLLLASFPEAGSCSYRLPGITSPWTAHSQILIHWRPNLQGFKNFLTTSIDASSYFSLEFPFNYWWYSVKYS